jgi:hypothetical protein
MQTPVEGAVAMIVPSKPIPAYKLKLHAGREELLRDCGGPKLVPRLYQGYCQFIRIACRMDASFTLLETSTAAVYLNADGRVTRVFPGELHRMLEYDGFAAVNINHDVFGGVSRLSMPMFMDKGISAGYALTVR